MKPKQTLLIVGATAVSGLLAPLLIADAPSQALAVMAWPGGGLLFGVPPSNFEVLEVWLDNAMLLDRGSSRVLLYVDADGPRYAIVFVVEGDKLRLLDVRGSEIVEPSESAERAMAWALYELLSSPDIIGANGVAVPTMEPGMWLLSPDSVVAELFSLR